MALLSAPTGTPSQDTLSDVRGRFDPKGLVSAFASCARSVLAQEWVADKSKEITAIPALLNLLDLSGTVVTIDAMG